MYAMLSTVKVTVNIESLSIYVSKYIDIASIAKAITVNKMSPALKFFSILLGSLIK